MGQCPCPRCLVKKAKLSNLGTKQDMTVRSKPRTDDVLRQERVKTARKVIYKDGYVVNSSRVDELLKRDSLVPTEVRSPLATSTITV